MGKTVALLNLKGGVGKSSITYHVGGMLAAVDMGEGCTVTIRWKKAGAITVLRALRRAARAVQEQERDGEAA